MRFFNFSAQPLAEPALAAEYRAAERLFSVRFGTAHLFIPRLFRARAIPYAAIRQGALQMEFVECPTSEFPAECYIYHLTLYNEAGESLPLKLDSYEKARRILQRLQTAAPHAQIRIPPKPPALL